MQFSDLRYLSAYLIPAACWVGLYFGGWLAPGSMWLAFVVVPLMELILPARSDNPAESVMTAKAKNLFFDYILYLNLPILYGLVAYYVWLLAHADWTLGERILSILNVGIVLGVCGINVAHELGHRDGVLNRWTARLLLLPVLYNHFTMEHNYGHHLRVATPEDPATARKDEPVYAFFLRSISGSYQNAWGIGARLLREKGKPAWQHELIWSHVAQAILLTAIGLYAGWEGLATYIGAAVIGILALEAVNYIEHYGMVRRRLASGRYEPQSERHSWNSNYELGRIMLFELVRHADHHFQSTRKYQVLRHWDASPQLPFGYPMSILIALMPPLWFQIMNPRVDAVRRGE
jgi:alkane 1-monooxygenase